MTAEKFHDYVSIQMSGVTNMFDINKVCSLSIVREREFDVLL